MKILSIFWECFQENKGFMILMSLSIRLYAVFVRCPLMIPDKRSLKDSRKEITRISRKMSI